MAIIRLDNIIPPFVKKWMVAEGVLDEYLKYARIDTNKKEGRIAIKYMFYTTFITWKDTLEDGCTIDWSKISDKFDKFIEGCGIHEKILRNEIVEEGEVVLKNGDEDTFRYAHIIKYKQSVFINDKKLLAKRHKDMVLASGSVFSIMMRLYKGEDVSISPLLNNVLSRESLINIANASNNQK